MRRIARPTAFAAALILVLGVRAAAPPAKTSSPNASWLAKAEQHIGQREYRASENGVGLQAPNRAHNLRTYFDVQGIRVHDRTAADSPELLRLSLTGVGRSGAITAAAPGEQVVAHESRVEIRRPGVLEWYENSPAGLEQGFTLDARPAGEGPLVVEVAVAGANAALHGDAISFESRSRPLEYGQLAAFDAAGQSLLARLEVPDPDRVRIVVDDSDARYPIAIDPLITETADSHLDSRQRDAMLGWSVAGAGDVDADGYHDVIVSAPYYDAGQTNEGAAFVFRGGPLPTANGDPGNAAAQLELDQPAAGVSGVASAGDVNGDGFSDVIVYSLSNGGAAYLFLGSASGIGSGNPASAATRLTSDQPAHALYNSASAGDVNGDGFDDVIVGGRTDNGQSYSGLALIFLGSASGIPDGTPATAATQIDGPNAPYGFVVAGAGDVNGDGYADVIVGQSDAGAFLFLGSPTGIASGATANAATQFTSDQPGSGFGSPVASAGDVNGDGYADVLISAPHYYRNEGPFGSTGSVFVFHGSASGISSGYSLNAATRLAGDTAYSPGGNPNVPGQFGYSAAGAGDVNGDGYDDVIVANPAQAAPYEGGGAAWVFLGSPAGIPSGRFDTAAAQLAPDQHWIFICPPNCGEDYPPALGVSVAGAGDVNGDGFDDVIAGAPGYNYDGLTVDSGAAFIYTGSDALYAQTPGQGRVVARLESDQDSARIGYSVANAGDVNHDGYDDVIVGAPYYDAGQTNEGAAFVFLGRAPTIASGSAAAAATQLESDVAGANLGESVAGAGDVDGDGFDDVIVGDPNYGSGAAFVFVGSASGVADGNPASAATRLFAVPSEVCPDPATTGFGVSVAGAGDVNDDGFGDVIVGAPWYPQASPCTPVAGPPEPGAAFVFNGSASGIADANPTSAAARLISPVPAWFGDSVAGAGDVNRDGYSDVIVGAPYYTDTESDEGAAFIFLGGAQGIANGSPATAATQIESNQARAHLGSSVASAGDLNRDRYADVIVGAPFYHANPASDSDEGAAFVFLGAASGIANGTPQSAAVRIVSDQDHSNLGWAVASAGDVNQDGKDDVIVGAPLYGAGAGGAAFLFHSGGVGIGDVSPGYASTRFLSSQDGARLGASVAGGGDINGDGRDDVIIGAPLYDAGQTDEGAVFVDLPEPDALLALAAGAALIAALRRSRRG